MKLFSDILVKLISFRFFFVSLEAENHRLSQQLVYSSAQNSYNCRPHEEMELLRAQVYHSNVFEASHKNRKKNVKDHVVGVVARQLARGDLGSSPARSRHLTVKVAFSKGTLIIRV